MYPIQAVGDILNRGKQNLSNLINEGYVELRWSVS